MLSRFTGFSCVKNIITRRSYSSKFQDKSGIAKRIEEILPNKRAQIKNIKLEYGDRVLGTCTVDQAYSGMRSAKVMVWEPSLLDNEHGIMYRGLDISELRKNLPRIANDTEEPATESLLWLLLTGDLPTQEQALALKDDLNSRVSVPQHVIDVLSTLSKAGAHPMTQLVTATAALQTQSKFAAAYQSGVHKQEYWIYTLEDVLDLLANLSQIAARIFANTYHAGRFIQPKSSFDYSANLAHQLGINSDQFAEYMRLFMFSHADHEGGNVSAHTTRLVGSALTDPYLSFSAAMSGLAGPLHGLANQEVLRWINGFQQEVGQNPTPEQVKTALWKTLKSGQVVPGYGHAVLRKTDPRYTVQREFALKYLPSDPLFKLVDLIYQVAPGVLKEHGKAKNPWPNVDAHSGCLLVHYGLTQSDFYTVLFGVSRAFGVLSSLVWDRALNLAIERPKSVTSDWINEHFSKPGSTA